MTTLRFLMLVFALPILACSSPEEKKRPAPKKIIRPKTVPEPEKTREALKSAKATTRLAALARFPNLKDEQKAALIPDLKRVLKGEGLVPEIKAQPALDSEGKVNPLAALNTDTDEERSKAEAGRLLGRYGDVRCFSSLLEAIYDDNYALRNKIAWAIAELTERHPVLRTKLIQGLRGHPGYVRKELLKVLARLKQDDETRAQFKAALRDPSVDVRIFAIKLVAESKPDRGLALYSEAFNGRDRFLQATAAEELVKISKRSKKDERDQIFALLVAGLKKRAAFRPISAAKALADLADPRALLPLCEMLKTRDKVTRRWSYEALVSLISEKKLAVREDAGKVLMGHLTHKSRDVRVKAATALGLGKVQKAKDALSKMAKDDKDKKARAAATMALAKIKGP